MFVAYFFWRNNDWVVLTGRDFLLKLFAWFWCNRTRCAGWRAGWRSETCANRRTGPIWALHNTWTVIQTWVDANRRDATRRKSNETIFLCPRRRRAHMHTNDTLRRDYRLEQLRHAEGIGKSIGISCWHWGARLIEALTPCTQPPYQWLARSEMSCR